MGHLMPQYPSDSAVIVLITIALSLCSGTGLSLNDRSRISGSSNESNPFVLASKFLKHFNEVENYSRSRVNKTSLKDQDFCSSREKLRTSTEILNLSILVTNEEEPMNQSRLSIDMVQRNAFFKDEQGLDFDDGNWTKESGLTNLLVANCSINSSRMFSQSRFQNEISGKSIEEPNDKFRLSKWPCSNLMKHFQTLIPSECLIPAYSKIKTDESAEVNGDCDHHTDYNKSEISTSIQERVLNSGSAENETDHDSSEISTSTQEHSLNINSNENETYRDQSEILTSIQKHSMNYNYNKNESDYDYSEISTSIQQYALSNNSIEIESYIDNSEISSSIQEYSLNNCSANTDQDTSTSIPLLDDDVDDTDVALTFTCKGRCGKKISFPCSCSATCVIYGTCCDNLIQDCPHVWYEGRNRFSHISRADLICDEDFLYKVVTCPKPVKENFEWRESISSNDNKPLVEKENKISMTKKWFPFDVQTSGTIAVTGSNPSRPSESDGDPQETIIERLNRALSYAPITDLDTGLTFMNKAIYDCHNMSEATALRWSLVFDYDIVNPTRLEDFAHSTTFTKYQPDLDEQIFKAHLCIPNIIETCNQAENFQELEIMYAESCPKSTAFLSSGRKRYRNRFCAYCNEGKHNKYALVSSHNMQFKGLDFHVLMTMSDSKTFSFRLSKPPLFSAKGMKLAWSLLICSVPDQNISPGRTTNPSVWKAEKSVCSVRCEDPIFTVRSDGMCKAEHHALLAIADDGLTPLCPLSIAGLARFLACGLESEVKSLRYADFSAPSASVMFDATFNRSLYIVKLHMALPRTSDQVLSHSREDLSVNIGHLALLARSFKDYRLSQNLCSQTKDVAEKTGLKVIHTKALADGSTFTNFYRGLTEDLEKLRGRILDNQTTTTVCFGSLHSYREADPNKLFCMDDPVFERDATLIRKFRNSSCFAHLENLEPAASNRAIALNENHSVLLPWVLCLNVLIVPTVNSPI
ncbi:hypothetical protein PoB_003940300 [Plakobranchus ocellatus]|uniref:SMB domain-containing protein n=1 Tax=Plakobranchus ocellatus TaxID=259542 RepID=A0AAV4B2F3_9GAST|nr:hypothetical protein PoB_003940300 [Plakobranchus ocellatus]